MSAYDRYDLAKLRQELVAGGIPVARLGLYIDPTTGAETWSAIDAAGDAMTLTPSAFAIIAAHAPAPRPAVPDFGAEVPENAAFLLADRVAQLRTYLDTPNASITPAMTVGALKLLTRVVLWLLRRSV